VPNARPSSIHPIGVSPGWRPGGTLGAPD